MKVVIFCSDGTCPEGDVRVLKHFCRESFRRGEVAIAVLPETIQADLIAVDLKLDRAMTILERLSKTPSLKSTKLIAVGRPNAKLSVKVIPSWDQLATCLG